jgi:hypothetical protein
MRLICVALKIRLNFGYDLVRAARVAEGSRIDDKQVRAAGALASLARAGGFSIRYALKIRQRLFPLFFLRNDGDSVLLSLLYRYCKGMTSNSLLKKYRFSIKKY